MATDTDRLIVTWEARLTQFEREMRRGQTVARAGFRRVEQETRNFEARFAAAGRRASGAFNRGLGLLGVGIGLNSLRRAFGTAINMADDMVVLADRIGITTGQLQEFHYAAKQMDVDLSDFNDSLDAFAKRLGDAAKGTGELLKVLEVNNVPLRDAEGNLRSVSDMLLEYADLMANASDEVTKAALSNAAFGRGNVQMQGLLSISSQGFRRFGDEAQRAGALIEDGLLRKTALLTDRWDAFTSTAGAQFQGLLLDVANAALDADGSIDGLQQRTVDFFTFIRENLPTLSNYATILGAISIGGKVGGAPGAAVGGVLGGLRVLDRSGLLTDLEAINEQLAQARAEVERINAMPAGGARTVLLADWQQRLDALVASAERLRAALLPNFFGDAFRPNASSAANPIRATGPSTTLTALGTTIGAAAGAELGDRFSDAFGQTVLTNDPVFAPVTRLPGEGASLATLAPGSTGDIARLEESFAAKLAELFAMAPDHIRSNAQIISGFRETAHQARLYEAEIAKVMARDHSSRAAAIAAIRRAATVAPPGSSRHERGAAADFQFGTSEAEDWFRSNAPRVGLEFPFGRSHDHIQELGEATRDANDAALDAFNSYDQLQLGIEAVIQSTTEETAAREAEIEALGLSTYEREKMLATLRLEQAFRDAGVTNLEEYRDVITSLAEGYAQVAAKGELAQETVDALTSSAEAASEVLGDAMKGFLHDLIAGKSAAEALGNVLQKIGSRLVDAGIDMLIGGIFNRGGIAGGGIGGFLGNLFGGGRAEGGPVDAGRLYRVGERGPELFAPRMAGVIVPNRQQGAAQQPIVVHLDVAANDYFDARVGQISAGTSRVVVNKAMTNQREMQRRHG